MIKSMTKSKAKFAMAFHCYQPVFNFEGEMEKAFDGAYLPLVKALENFPEIKTSFHFSGNMIEWLQKRHPEYIDRVRKMIAAGRIELIGGGCFEPIMSLIPERDRKGQISMNQEIAVRAFGVKPRGVWIAERVWEPSLVETLCSVGIEYTIVDDHHLLRAGLTGENVFSPCRTTRGEKSQVLFPALTRLRYSMPFRKPQHTLDYLKNATEDGKDSEKCFFFADDAEKFGAWPYTYRWVHDQGWLTSFLEMLTKNSGWLETTTYSEILDSVTPVEVGEVPESSYPEMMEWSGGSFGNFLKKYPEADRMHKRMISVSENLADIERNDEDPENTSRIGEATKELFKAQTSCAYWHGTFGGLYLPHLRAGVYRHLIKAQNIMDKGSNPGSQPVRCVERETSRTTMEETAAVKETVIQNGSIGVFVKPAEGGTIGEIDYKPLNLNLSNTMSRVKEEYHGKLERGYARRIRAARMAIVRGDMANIHDVLGIRDRGLKKILRYDDYSRGSFLTHVFVEDMRRPDMIRVRPGHDSFLKGRYTSTIEAGKESITQVLSRRDKVFTDKGKPFDLTVVKKINVGTDPLVVLRHSISKHSGPGVPLKYAIEFNFLLWDESAVRDTISMRSDSFSLEDRHSGLKMAFNMDKRLPIFMYPVYSVNETEAGLGKTFQGVSILIGGELGAQTAKDETEIRIKIGKQ